MLEKANDMGLNVGNINLQFAFMRHEAKNDYRTGWESLKNASNYQSACEITWDQIEECHENIDKRLEYLELIYKVMKDFE